MIEVVRSKLRILDFDIETRKVGFHTGGRFSPDGCEPTAVAWSWIGEQKIHLSVLSGETELDRAVLLADFIEAYDVADIVTGHYIRKFDLPILSGACMELEWPPLTGKLVSDTKCDLKNRAGLSASQENLAGMYQLEASKFHMGDHAWRDSTRLTKEGIALTAKRVVDDVKQHKALRERLLEAGFLNPPRRWSP